MCVLLRFSRVAVSGNSDLCFVWPGSIDAARAHLERHTVAIELGPVDRHGAGGVGRSVYFRDPDGSLLEPIAYQNDAPAPVGELSPPTSGLRAAGISSSACGPLTIR